jgi:hypothetical protein
MPSLAFSLFYYRDLGVDEFVSIDILRPHVCVDAGSCQCFAKGVSFHVRRALLNLCVLFSRTQAQK